MKRKKSGTRKIERNQEQKNQWKRAAIMSSVATLLTLAVLILLLARQDWFFGNFASAAAGVLLIGFSILVGRLVYERRRRQGFEFAAVTWMQEHRLDDKDVLPAVLQEVLRSMDGKEEPDNEEDHDPDAPVTQRQLSEVMQLINDRLPKKDPADPALPNGAGGKGSDPKPHSAP
jgi:hypothetical protein